MTDIKIDWDKWNESELEKLYAKAEKYDALVARLREALRNEFRYWPETIDMCIEGYVNAELAKLGVRETELREKITPVVDLYD